MMLPRSRRRRSSVAFGLWLFSLVAVFLWLARQSVADASYVRSPEHKPGSLATAHRGSSLWLSIHPRCPCTRATIAELSAILRASADTALRCTVLVVIPEGATGDWMATDVVEQARALPATSVVADSLGLLSGELGAERSGQAVLYSPGGELLFSGGLTASRGHRGPAPSQSSLAEAIATATPRTTLYPTYGCNLTALDCRAEEEVQ